MKKMECLKRILSLVLALSIMLSCVPVQVFALETEPQSVPETTAPTETTAPAETDPTETTAPADTQPPETTIPADTQPPATTEPAPTETTEVTEPSVPETTVAVEPAFSTMIMMADASRSTEIVESLWNGKSAVFVGDSITAGSGTDKIYYQYLNETLGFSSVTAMGVAGSCISAASDYGQSNQPLISRYQDIPAADLIVIFMGTNDYGHETPLGSIEDTQDGTFYGALNTMIPVLTAKHSSGKIVFVTPMHRYGFGTSKILGTQFTSDNIPNGVGAALGDYVEALKTVCGKHGVSVIDLYTECTLDPADPEVRTNYMPDGLHPNAAGHELIAGIMESHIREYSPVENAPGTESDEETELVYGNRFADGFDQQNRASSRINQYLKAGTVITLKDPATFQWACVKTSNENSSNNLGYFPDSAWTDKESAVVEADGWIGFVFKYRDESQVFDLSQPLSDYITIEEPHTHSYEAKVTAPTCTEQGYTTYTCDCSDSYVGDYVDAKGHSYKNGICTICGEKAPDLAGKTISILGASISTFAGTSNGAGADTSNSTIRNNVKYYPNTTIPEVGLNDTWWMQVAEDLGLRLLVNNAWSGSAILLERSGTVGAYVDRCVQLHDDTGDNAGEAPDIICIQMGFNDFSYGKETLGTAADIDYDTLITTDGYGTPSTTMEATAIMLDKITKRYPDAEVYMFNHFKRIGQSAADTTLMEGLNGSIETVCARYGVKVVDLYTTLTDPAHIGDGRLHPNKLGMDVISEAVKTAIIGNTNYQVTTHTAKLALDGVTADYGTDKILVDGTGFTVKLTAPAGDTLSVTVTMGGEDITDAVYTNGTVSIEAVNGDVVITAQTVHTPKDYRWEFNGTDLACVSGDNALTKKAGTTTEGVFSSTRYALAAPVVLNHDQPWVVEWKSEGTFQNSNGSSGARVFTSDDVNANYNARYIFKSNTNGIIAMGEKTTTGSHNYGIALKDHGIDWTALHTYRLENRIANDGSNMVYLWVDGAEIGPMTHYYVGTTDKKTTSDWLSGKDFVLPYMGTDTHGFTNCSIDYIQVWEGGKPEQALAGKVISILGDSISTFAGYIPVADGFNLEHLSRYPQDNLVTDVNETWWMQIIDQLDAKLGINDSWRGATVSGAAPVTTGTTGANAAMANLNRIQNLGSNGTPNVILFYGGTNDLAHVSKVGSFDPATAPSQVDLTTASWDNLADGYVHTLLRLKHYYPDAIIVAMLPTYTASYYSNTKLAQANELLAKICEHYSVPYVDLRDSGVTAEYLPDGIHPGAEGMDMITDAVLEVLAACETEAGDHTVHPVSHTLTNVKASLGHYKGIDAGAAFRETLSADGELLVTVTMNGQDITDTCYSDGVISIDAVSGALAITAKAKFSLEGHWQALPGSYHGKNLWPLLDHDAMYYTVDGWAEHASGKVRSVTVSVTPGEKIVASSFAAAGTNGSSVDGIRVTFFSDDGVLVSMSADAVHKEFAENGYLTVPENATAVCIPMWTPADTWELYIHEAAWKPGAEGLAGKTISILGDSISTFAGVSNNTAYNSTIGSNAVYYSEGTLGVTRADTWWQQTIDILELELLVNNAWSGSCILPTRANTVGAYVDRCVQLHNDQTGEAPDIIAVFMGTNDFSYYQSTLGTAPADYDALITDNGDGSFTYAEPVNSCQAYAIMLHKMTQRYPNAEIYCMNLLARRDPVASGSNVGQPTAFNAELVKIIERFGCHLVDLENCGITSDPANFDLYMGDKRVHPNAAGMDMMTEAVASAIKGEPVEVCSVIYDLGGVVSVKAGFSGNGYSAELAPEDGYENMSVSVTMDGVDITERCYSDGKIKVADVTGDLVITASAEKIPENYRWEFDGKDLVSAGKTENKLTLLEGMVADGVFSSARYKLSKSIVLRHDKPWRLEWKGEGTGGFMLAEASSASAAPFFFRRAGNYLNAFGSYNGSQYDNYGIALDTTDIDGSAEHRYCLENRISGNGTNMVWLYVDGAEVGPLENHYVGGSAKGTTGDWISGRDFTINYFGTTSHPLTDYAMEYLQVWEGGKSEESVSFAGKTVSILGHSMSTYAGVSNNTADNSTIGSNDVYYTEGKLGVYREDTWWQQAIDALGMELLVNNSWSGSCVFQPRKGEASVGYGDRAVNLHNDHTGEEPDIIWVYIGCNDFAYYKDTFGTGDAVDYSSLIQENGDGTFTYAAPQTACEAYAIMLHKVETRYPDAEVYCITSTARRDPDYTGDSYPDAGQPTAYMAELHKVAKHFACPVVDLEDCIPKEAEQFDQYIGDKRAHANALGMDNITCEVLSVMLDEKAEICHVTCENGAVKEQAVLLGGSYSAEVALQEGYSLTVTMGGEDVTEKAYQDGKITIDEVTGDIAVYAVISREPMNFGWALKDGELVSVGETENSLRKIAGTVTDGLLNDGRFELTTSVMLKHDLPWEVEWKCAENWRGVLLSTAQNAKTEGMTYLSRVNGGQLCFGTWTGTQYDNYGVDISYLDDQSHTYRLRNRPAADGSNMVWLYVDGVEIGPMDQYYIGSNDQNKTADWISGQDFVLHYIGMEGHALRNCRLDYLRIRESGHTHDYASAVTEPTCTEQGYTTHTCTVCGDSYVDSETAALGHTEIVDPALMESSGKSGLTEGRHCSVCNTVLAAQEIIPAKGYDWMLEDGVFNLLLIGNSYSEDASNCGQGMKSSQLLDILKTMLGEDVKIQIGLCYSGGKGINWHATQSEQGNAAYSLRTISTDDPAWKSQGACTSADALVWADWDVISLQHYDINTSTGMESVPYPDTTDEKFYPMETASEYMLDHIAKYAPGADVYFYMHWAQTKAIQLDAGIKRYEQMAAYLPVVLDYVGTENGKRFENIIPVGLSVQNARTTYLALLAYNTSAYDDGNLNLTTDAQIGLQRDGGHLSFNIGRYIAALTFAESILPKQLRVGGYVLPEIRVTESVGKLPKEYTEIAQKAVLAAVESWKNGSLAVTKIDGYTDDPVVSAGAVLETMTLPLVCDVADGLKNQICVAVETALPADFAVDAVEMDADNATATVTIHFGYSSTTVEMTYSVAEHEYNASYTEPTCTEQGYTTYTCACGDYYVGAYVAAKGHSYDAVVTEPTCTEQGYTTYTCTACGDSYVDNEIAAFGHTEVTDQAVEATCTTTGLTEGKRCSVCETILVKQEVIPAKGHTEVIDKAVAATCTETGLTEGKHCSVCSEVLVKQEVVAAKGHTEAIDKAVDATCTETGLTEGKHCSVCGEILVKQEVIPAKGHTEVIDKAVEATCTETGLTEGKHCSVCGEVLVKQEMVLAKDHSWDNGEVTKEPTEETDGERVFTCTVCGEIRTEIIPSLNHVHTYDLVVTAPTCTEKGYTTHTCRCGDSYVDSYVEATGHSYGEWMVTTAPTCTEKGTERRACAKCDAYETRDIAATGHVEVIDKATDATCTETGLTEGKHCSVCSEVLVKQEVVPAKGHTEVIDKVVEATCTETGLTEGKHCSVCGEVLVKQEVVAAKGHTEAIDKAVAATCTETGLTEGKHCSVCDTVLVKQNVIPAKGHVWNGSVCSSCGQMQGYRIDLDPAALGAEDSVWIDGVEYPAAQDGRGWFTMLDHTNATNLVIYTYNDPYAQDVHTQYPTGMKVWTLHFENGAYTAQYIPGFDNLLQYSGSSIRIVGVKGIRMITSIEKSKRDALTGAGLDGYTLVEYGTAVAWTSDLAGGEGLLLGKPYTKSNFAYKRGVADPIFNDTGDLLQYTNVLVGFSDDQCIPDLAMRPYIILEDADGRQITIYGGTVCRSIGYIAWQNRTVFPVGSAAYEYVWGIIHHVYGDRFDADYKG